LVENAVKRHADSLFAHRVALIFNVRAFAYK
jgi:hypothetical protein